MKGRKKRWRRGGGCRCLLGGLRDGRCRGEISLRWAQRWHAGGAARWRMPFSRDVVDGGVLLFLGVSFSFSSSREVRSLSQRMVCGCVIRIGVSACWISRGKDRGDVRRTESIVNPPCIPPKHMQCCVPAMPFTCSPPSAHSDRSSTNCARSGPCHWRWRLSLRRWSCDG